MATARKEAIAMGLVFFWIKFSLWIALILLSSSIGPLSELPTLPYVALEIFIVFLACSALPDLALVYGLRKKDVKIIWQWNFLQPFLGGIFGGLGILLTMKAIREIKEEQNLELDSFDNLFRTYF